jgi:ATP-dependent exoDNAse (exonuclease V) alpha subunit
MAEPTPTPEQAAALAALAEPTGNLLLTGVAGTGKTFVGNRWLESLGDRASVVAMTASTGIAATHIGGRTIHSWSGAGIGKRTAQQIRYTDYWRDGVAPDLRAAEYLLIDEISMLDAHIFELASELCCIARKDLRPFGGLRVVMVGDFGQLAPVEAGDKGFVFESKLWWDMNVRHVELTQVMRTGDPWYVWFLRCIRDGHLPPQAEEILRQRTRAYDPEAMGATRLMTHNEQADRINVEHLERLETPEVVYEAIEAGDPELLLRLDEDCLSPKRLRLRAGARVMFTRNDQLGRWVNGTLGTVERTGPATEEFPVWVRIDGEEHARQVNRAEWKTDAPAIKKGSGKRTAARRQVPLRLAWAITVHKSQGMTLPLVSVDLGNTFAPGQAYVALSRARSLFGLNIEAWGGRRSIIAHPKALAFMRGTYRWERKVRRQEEWDIV